MGLLSEIREILEIGLDLFAPGLGQELRRERLESDRRSALRQSTKASPDASPTAPQDDRPKLDS